MREGVNQVAWKPYQPETQHCREDVKFKMIAYCDVIELLFCCSLVQIDHQFKSYCLSAVGVIDPCLCNGHITLLSLLECQKDPQNPVNPPTLVCLSPAR